MDAASRQLTHNGPGQEGADISEKLRRSRQRLLDLTLRNRLLNFRAGDPSFNDDLRGHKHLPLKGKVSRLWDAVVEDGKKVEILCLTKEQQFQLQREAERRREWSRQSGTGQTAALVVSGSTVWDEASETIRGVASSLDRGDLFSLLPREAFAKRLKKIRGEQNTLIDSTGDSALFLAIGFAEWSEDPPHPKAGQPLFAPLILIHVHLEEVRAFDGGERRYMIEMDLDQPQDNPCLLEKLRQDFAIDLPRLAEEDTAENYLARVRKALRSKKSWNVHTNIALGFFNFARYRLWLDLDPEQWPEGTDPGKHKIVQAILNGEWYDQQGKIPSDEEVAEHQQTTDLPLVMDADSTQYASLLAATNGMSLVVVGPPGSGKSQTITNLIAAATNAGKRVLFVAQKVAALAVVQRRLQQAGLLPFCLPLFSDKARATELHKHLESSVHARSEGFLRSKHNSGSATLARKLNDHATRLRTPPAGYGEDVSVLLRTAAALNIQMRDVWGPDWEARLLEVNVPDGQPKQEWFTSREQVLHEWHRLRTEVGDSWSNWHPTKLGPLDTSKVEGAVKRYADSALDLAVHTLSLPPEVCACTVAQIETVVSKCCAAKFSPLAQPLQALVDYLWADPQNQALVSRLETELTEIGRQRSKAETCLRFTESTRDHVSRVVGDALSVLNAMVSAKCTLQEARQALDRLSALLKLSEDMMAHNSLLPTGCGELGLALPPEPSAGITWKHVQLFAAQDTSRVDLPPGTRLALLRHVLHNDERAGAAKKLADVSAAYHAAIERVEAVVVGLTRFRNGGDRDTMVGNARTLSEAGLGGLRCRDLPEMKTLLTGLAKASLEFTKTVESSLLPADFGKIAFDLEAVGDLAKMTQVPVGALLPPSGTLPDLIHRLPLGNAWVSELRAFAGSIESCLTGLTSLRSWFPSLHADAKTNEPVATLAKSLADVIRALGLGHESLGHFSELRAKAASYLEKLRGAQHDCGELWAHFPTPAPQTLDDLNNALRMLKHLAHAPDLPTGVSWEALAHRPSVEASLKALGESSNLMEFRNLYGSRIAFRDAPQPDAISAIRRDVRQYLGRWWRWLAPRYRNARREAGRFLSPPLPTDSDVVNLLDKLETHERHRIKFGDSDIKRILGTFFQGIDTEWAQIEPVLAWLQDLFKMSGVDDVTPFIRIQRTNADALRRSIASIEQATAVLDPNLTVLQTINPVKRVLQTSEPISLAALIEALETAERNLSFLRVSGEALFNAHESKTGAEFTESVNELLELQNQLGDALESPLHVAGLEWQESQPARIRATADWIEVLERYRVTQETLRLLGRGGRSDEQLRSIGTVCEQFLGCLNKVGEDFPSGQRPPWLAMSAPANAVLGVADSCREAAGKLQELATNYGWETHRTISGICDDLDSLAESDRLAPTLDEWEPILGEDPKSISPDDLSGTLGCLDRMRATRAPSSFLRWVVQDEVQARLEWWKTAARLGQELVMRLKELQKDFLVTLSGSGLPLDGWASDLTERCARCVSALSTFDSVSQSEEFELQAFTQSYASLNRVIEIVARISGWHERLGVLPESLQASTVAAHRTWVATLRTFPPFLSAWLKDEATGSRAADLLAAGDKCRALRATGVDVKRTLEEFGAVSGFGPFTILDPGGTAEEAAARAEKLLSKLPLLSAYAGMLRERRRATDLGLGNLVTVAERKAVDAERLIDTFRAAVAWQQAKAVWEADEDLRLFSSGEHEQTRRKFREADQRQLESNQKLIAKNLASFEVEEGATGRTPRDLSGFQLLRHEMGKKRKHVPIRKLVERAGKSMQDLCPCWMMSPLAVAQFLPAGSIGFDLVIMDEASQLNPEDTWGAIARGKQLIVVGDQKQMPPSDFFSSTFEEDESVEDEEIDGGKADSILDAAIVSLRNTWLEWHYRSRHETLIAPANQFSYSNRLILFPSPHQTHPELGLRYHFVDGATTTTGRVTNPMEAEKVANRLHELVTHHSRKTAQERLSIGVVAMNIHQQECIQDLVDARRRNDSRFDAALALMETETDEPVFIKNLENIQGDERDIMLISCTYGPQTAGGTIAQRFGPLNREGGERRFNVLITRAKWRMEVFASMKSQDIITEGKKRGVQDLHLFLKYAETGRLDDPGAKTDRGHDSPFEEQVEAILEKAGFSVECQIGVAGYYIDLAVRHPADKGRFALGIECDGETYHSSKAARDRDRLREQVLKERGWKLHRIWSTDWFLNHQQARAGLFKAVDAACKM